MPDYDLLYWPVPFRGQFVRAVLAHAGAAWDEADPQALRTLKEGPVAAMPAPFMGPPVLVDRRAGVAVSQTVAILAYLGETLGLQPATPAGRALTLKVACDACDVIDDMTLDGGRQMWTPERWAAFEPRLRRWMALWEDLGRRHGLTPDAGFLLGGDAPGIADMVTAVLWSTPAERFPRVAALLEESAPMTAALSRRVSALPPLAALAAKAREDYGDAWCGGEIEASLRKVLG